MDTPIPKFKPNKFYVEMAEKAPRKVAELLAMTEKQKVELGKKLKKESIERNQGYITRALKENERLEEMEQKVLGWTPPTPDHTELKKFMLEQINTSKNSLDYSQRALKSAEDQTAIEYFMAELRSAERDVKYYNEHLQKEVERSEERNQWVEDLKASLK